MDGRLVSLLCVLDRWGGVVGSDETLTGLVRVQDTSLLLVGSVDGVKVGKVLYTEERVESGIATLVLGNFILKTENFVVCQLSVWMQVDGGTRSGLPSGDQAQTRAIKHKSKNRTEPWRRAMIALVM
jgi:hypothetical protein